MFRFSKTADGASSRPLERILVGEGKKVNIGGLVKLAAGGIENVSAVTDRVYGICVSLEAADGSPLDVALPELFNGTYVKGVSFTQAGSNPKPVNAVILPVLPNDVVVADADDDLGTTTGSDVVGSKLDVSTGDTRFLKESTVASATQFQIVGIKGERKVAVKLLLTGLTA